MKPVFILLLVAVAVFLLVACSRKQTAPATASTTTPTTEPNATPQNFNTQWDGRSLRVLCVGNSFARNATKVLYQIAEAEGVEEIVLGVLHIGGCTVERHYNNSLSGEAAYKYYKNTTGEWELTENATLLYGLQDEPWDVITITQGQGLYGIPNSYDGCLDGLIEYINANKLNPNAQLAFHMTWAFPPDSTNSRFKLYAEDQETMFKAICQTGQALLVEYPDFCFILPSGTAIQNARGPIGEVFFNEDLFHLNSFGEYVAGYMWYASLTGQPITELKYIPESVAPMKSAHGHIVNAVNGALNNPFEVTQLP